MFLERGGWSVRMSSAVGASRMRARLAEGSTTHVVDAAELEARADDLPQYGALEPLADRVVVRADGRAAVMGQARLPGRCLERLPVNSGPLPLRTRTG